MQMARPFQTRSIHWNPSVSMEVKVSKEGCNASGWLTEQGKALALGSGRIASLNLGVVTTHAWGETPFLLHSIVIHVFFHCFVYHYSLIEIFIWQSYTISIIKSIVYPDVKWRNYNALFTPVFVKYFARNRSDFFRGMASNIAFRFANSTCFA